VVACVPVTSPESEPVKFVVVLTVPVIAPVTVRLLA
jgi:hypothetical protein